MHSFEAEELGGLDIGPNTSHLLSGDTFDFVRSTESRNGRHNNIDVQRALSPLKQQAQGMMTETTLDGRPFFRKARAVLNHDEYRRMLGLIKAFNSKEDSKSKTLQLVRDILITKYPELYGDFERLMYTL